MRFRLPPDVTLPHTALHVERDARSRYDFPDDAFTVGGRLLEVDLDAAQRITNAMNAARDAGQVHGERVSAGELVAAALLHELAHALLAAFDWRPQALAAVRGRLGESDAAGLFEDFRWRFPPPAVGGPSDEVTLEELFLLGEAQDNRALDALAELFALGDLTGQDAFHAALTDVRAQLANVPVRRASGQKPGALEAAGVPIGAAAGGDDLLTLLRAPAVRHPGSLFDQLSLAIEQWVPLLDGRLGGAWTERLQRLLRRALRALDLLREERVSVLGPGPMPPPRFEFEADALQSPGEAAYSSDSDWMQRVVMVAKNAFVWLEQLSRRHGRKIDRLDQVPDEALEALAAQGFDTLWLVGIWQRSEASKTIKRLRGQPFAEASAYAIFDYVIAEELGGDAALHELAARAQRHGLRLASDMVPNHTGLDARWVAEHPEWFLTLDAPPFAGYSFAGPDLTPGRSIEVRIEDGYYDGSDAAVVFQRRERSTGRVSYPYHGNDGTAMPWNDTAQLDYLNPEVRAAVIETIVEVARRFKVIRFDAAMTLVKRHVRRLWHPPAGEGGAIPTRSLHALSEAEFEAAMPREFWREVVDTVAARAPDTLLVAEAFWLLESYFVRTLGLHRVYNSAFMHLLAGERNAEHRLLLRRALQRDPRDLERYVNYLTTPDEETAAETFGTGEKYFGAAFMLATFPGLPLFGHGQVEGLWEKYGMEFRAPRLEEPPNAELIERHQAVIAPLLQRRHEFATTDGFALADLVGAGAEVHDDVYVYLFARSGQRDRGSLILFNNSPQPREGVVTGFVAAAAADGLPDLPAALGFGSVPDDRALSATAHSSNGRTAIAGGERVSWGAGDLRRSGLRVTLAPYEAVAYIDIAESFAERSIGPQQGAPVSISTASSRRTTQPVSVIAGYGPRSAASRRAAARRRR